jgi:hypothetical protein
MSLDEKFIPVRTVFYETVGNFSRRQLDYWDTHNPGMPTISDLPSEVYTRSKFLDNLPRHRTFGLQFSDLKRGLK